MESGTFDVVSEVGDPVGGGYSYSYTDGEGSADAMYAGWDNDGNQITVIVQDGASGDRWSVVMGAEYGKQLAPGTYTGAADTPTLGAPKLSVSGTFYGCESEGSFTIDRLVLGPRGYVEALDASFEQNCEGTDPGLTGQVHLTNPLPPAELTLGVDIAASGTVGASGKPAVHGTVTCTEPVNVLVNGSIDQVVAKGGLATASYYTRVDCTPGTPAAWAADGTIVGGVPFERGDATVEFKAQATDPVYEHTVVTDLGTANVSLRKS
ncbi:hypothetical protein OG978_19535 [Streptomyces sp. NBC_01591]|uniref:hypothetical protein n=1 Tax=Streptomyces sp. NBC_01591 TaxID=2975888 RepID=UPI002DDBDEF5|nr:hypothetical protein [Streptomyces sp. NBC_01591]WSD69394.1 hypothetical protein OG978_19535 [Streptomyces sp. NBC_01591]